MVIPSFQQGAYIEEAILSVLGQGYPSVELLIVDGGSTDGTLGTLRRYEDEVARWVSEPDRGQSDALNKGLAWCTGDLVAFIGADDLFFPGAFHDAAELFARRPDCGAVVGAFCRIDEASRVISPPVPAQVPHDGPYDPVLAEPGSWRLHQVSTFFSRHALDEVGRWVCEDLRYTMDRELLNRVARRRAIVTSARPYAGFRMHPSSKSVAEILQFSRELAQLHLRDAEAGEPRRVRRRRRALARRQLGKGWIKLARSEPRLTRGLRALAAVPFASPRMACSRGYVVAVLEVLGMADRVRRATGWGTPGKPWKPCSIEEVVNAL